MPADLMHRNLDRRVETLVRLQSDKHVQEVSDVFDLAMDAGTSAWDLNPDGSWSRHSRDAEGNPLIDLQEYLIEQQNAKRDA